jgi:aspartate/methionine/tyrosine aminotransferase
MWHINDFYGVNAAHPAELLSVIALEHLPEIASRYEKLLEVNRPIVNRFLDAHPDFEVARQPHGTVLFPRLHAGDCEGFCRLLRDRYETSVVPGSFFEEPQHFRMYLAASTAVLTEGLDRLASALAELWRI